ncbi:hypothetical protein [Roseixanthobacter liquoris]|uniref:hypothetical protein n=1 Tax=Roseixanthobacter liquoris TaxID=3119921 RepID=UPI00372B1CC6
MARELRGWARPRPIRIAFLIQEGEYAAVTLDAIFADCYSRWGGRFSLVVPCIDGRISQVYWPWLETFDPDLIYSYVSLSREDIIELHERLCPAKYTFHGTGGDHPDDPSSYRPSYESKPLSSLSTIFRSARYTRVRGEGAAVQIIDSWHTESATRFLTDNFGTYRSSQGSGMFPSDATGIASLLTIVSPEAQADRHQGVPRDLNAIPNEMAAFVAFAEGQATSLAMASQLFAPKLEIQAGRWSGTFNLVVGDSFSDRVMFWNARLFIPSWLDSDLCCFRITPGQAEDNDFVQVLVSLINRRNHVNRGSGGQPQLAIRSCSLDPGHLDAIRQRLATSRLWGAVKAEAIAGPDALVPTDEALSNAREGNRFGDGLFPRADWMEFVWTGPSARPLATTPDHLVDAPPRQVFAQGYWGTDYLFEYDGPGPRFGGNNRWILPRRWRMAQAFQVRLANTPPHALLSPRRSRGGALAVFHNADHPIDTITVPITDGAFYFALTQDGRWAAQAEEYGQIEPPSKVDWANPSNEARYLAGVLGMAGGLLPASSFLLHPFLRDFFARLGGTPGLQPDKVKPTVDRLRKLAPRLPAFDLRGETEREALGTLIVKAAKSLKNPLHFVKYEDMKRGWKEHRAAYQAAHPQLGEPDPSVDWDKLEEDSLDASLIAMRRRQMVFQGHQWTCSNCHHRNWVDLGSLAPELSCEVCKTVVQAPVAINWLFRPNEFLIESLRDHSVLSLVWVLTVLLERSRSSFIYTGPTWFGFRPDSEEPDAEADLLVLSDGQAILCEVKSSWHSLRGSDIRDLVNLAKRLRPDLALLAVMESGAGPQAELMTAKADLEGVGIGFELLIPHAEEHRDDLYLPSPD